MRKLLAVLVFAFAFLLGNLYAASNQDHPDSKRTHKIQVALVRAGYLKHVTNVWDSQTEDALRELQKDSGWQHKVVPDSRALIALGLGPDNTKLLNPETAMVSFAAPKKADKPVTPILAALR